MKNLLLVLISLFVFAGCSKSSNEVNPEEPDVNGEPKEYIVSLGMTGEIEISESPLLGRASSDDLYGIQVYTKTATTEYTPYAYGLFDDKSKMTIKLLEGYQYKFITTMIVNGKNYIYKSPYTNSYGVDPFSIGGYTLLLENKFVYNSNLSMIQISYGEATLFNSQNSSVNYRCPNIDRYYGEVMDYMPTENGKVSVDMKRVVFGVRFIADGLTEGKLKISIQQAPELIISYGGILEISEIFTFPHRITFGGEVFNSNSWTKDDYTETIPVSVSWEKADGAIVPLINQDITFKRKTLSTITIKVKDSSVNNGVEINQESGDLIAGDNITIESGTGTDTPVDPNI